MKIGQTVNFYDPKTGDRKDAEILAIVGATESRKKLLNLKVGEDEFTSVYHGDDAGEGAPFWLIKGEEIAPPGWADKKKGKKEKQEKEEE